MNSTPLSTILNRMNRYKSADRVEEGFKVRDIDSALRKMKRNYKFPWMKKQSNIRVFDSILFYPVASDHNDLVYLDNDEDFFENKERFKFTSLRDFLDNPDSRSDLADIFDNGERFLGIRKSRNNVGSQQLSSAEVVGDYSVSDDADSVALDNVIFKEGNGSMKITITSSSGTATIKDTFDAINDSNYKQKYHFRQIYLDAAPTSIEMRLQTDDSNYLSSGAITTQFSGQAFKADAWNLIAYDLNTASETGTFDSTSIASEKVITTGAASGTYFLDESSLKQWELLEYWYYSNYNIKTASASVPDQEYFRDDNEAYETDSELVGDDEWIDLLTYEALKYTMVDEEDAGVLREIKEDRDDAVDSLEDRYPANKPTIQTNYYRFQTDYNSRRGNPAFNSNVR